MGKVFLKITRPNNMKDIVIALADEGYGVSIKKGHNEFPYENEEYYIISLDTEDLYNAEEDEE